MVNQIQWDLKKWHGEGINFFIKNFFLCFTLLRGSVRIKNYRFRNECDRWNKGDTVKVCIASTSRRWRDKSNTTEFIRQPSNIFMNVLKGMNLCMYINKELRNVTGELAKQSGIEKTIKLDLIIFIKSYKLSKINVWYYSLSIELKELWVDESHIRWWMFTRFILYHGSKFFYL